MRPSQCHHCLIPVSTAVSCVCPVRTSQIFLASPARRLAENRRPSRRAPYRSIYSTTKYGGGSEGSMVELKSAISPDDPLDRDKVARTTRPQKTKNQREGGNWKMKRKTLSDRNQSVRRAQFASFYRKIAERRKHRYNHNAVELCSA